MITSDFSYVSPRYANSNYTRLLSLSLFKATESSTWSTKNIAKDETIMRFADYVCCIYSFFFFFFINEIGVCSIDCFLLRASRRRLKSHSRSLHETITAVYLALDRQRVTEFHRDSTRWLLLPYSLYSLSLDLNYMRHAIFRTSTKIITSLLFVTVTRGIWHRC